MIANCLLLPSETSPGIDDVKRALLSYDRVFLYAPDDRDFMVAEAYQLAASGVPVGFGGVPTRPLGKVSGYDDSFSRLLEACQPAIEQGSLQLLPSASVPVDPTMKSSRLMIGFAGLPPNAPNPNFLLHTYRTIATSPRLVTAVGRGLELLPPISEEIADQLAPIGIDDQQWTYETVGVHPPRSLPSTALYDGFAHTDEERLLLTRMSLARLAALVRALCHCQMLRLQPFTSDAGYASVVQQLGLNAREVVQQANGSDPADERTKAANRLTRLHNIVLAEFLDIDVLATMSVTDTLKLRDKAWGKGLEHRDRLAGELRQIAVETGSPEAFDAACRKALNEYRTARLDWESSFAQLRIKTLADIGKIALAGVGGEFAAEVAQNYVHMGSFDALLIVGGLLFLRTVGDRGPELKALLDRQAQNNELPGCGLARTYAPFLGARRFPA